VKIRIDQEKDAKAKMEQKCSSLQQSALNAQQAIAQESKQRQALAAENSTLQQELVDLKQLYTEQQEMLRQEEARNGEERNLSVFGRN